ncbi:hypothetical protein PanWU01x14_004360 [Parasponia andersonii]|uniref:RNase H type-1 domain-containing protein n=1 Tax=Parasponia andersonii TaxID=3476 RepID=A0A2P5E361_PARAD|nr:hypothetical protein PanWU01x14_004360 [Parasponia andersonii]
MRAFSCKWYKLMLDRQISGSNLCPVSLRKWCGLLETLSHALNSCSSAKEVWISTLHEDTSESLLGVFWSLDKESFDLFYICLWSIWSERNKAVHGSHVGSIEAQVVSIDSFLREFLTFLRSQQVKVREDSAKNLSWTAPEPGYVKLNVDASVVPGSPFIGIGFVLWDHLGHVLAAGAQYL